MSNSPSLPDALEAAQSGVCALFDRVRPDLPVYALCMRSPSSESAVASIFGERGAHRSGLHPGLELGDQLGVSLGFPVYRVLQPLELVLEVRHPRFKRLEAVRRHRADLAARLTAERGKTANLADPGDQSGAIDHRHRRIISESLSTCWRRNSCFARRCSAAGWRTSVTDGFPCSLG
jgi:hypothetical protein